MGKKDCCFVLEPRYGCMIIVLVELLWYFTNLYIAIGILFDGFKSHIIQENYYNHTTLDLGKLINSRYAFFV